MRAALLLAGLLLLAAAPARPEAHIRDLEVQVEGHRALLSFQLVDAFDDELRERIQSGLPTGIVYELALLYDRKHWWDKNLTTSSLQVVAMFNAVTREYLVNYKLDGRLIESRQVHDLQELERVMTRFESLSVFSLDKFPRDWRLLVAARAELGAHTIASFIPTQLVTEWTESKKFRPPPEGPP